MADAVAGATETVARMMGELLSQPVLGPADDFFIEGGDSLRAVELVTLLSMAFPQHDSAVDAKLRSALLMVMFDEATPAALGRVIERYSSGDAGDLR